MKCRMRKIDEFDDADTMDSLVDQSVNRPI